MLLEAVNARKAGGGQKLAVHTQVGVAARARPVGQLGVDAFAVDDQGRQQANVLASVGFEQLGGNAIGALRHDGRAVVHAMLYAQLHIQETQEMPHLGGGAHGGLAPAA